MKALALIESAEHVCYRYRLEAFAWALAERGLFLEAVVLAKETGPRIRQFLAARRAGVVILQRKLLPCWQLSILRRTARCLIYDVDDALFQHDSFSPKGARSRTRLGRFALTVHAADAVIAGNMYLRHRVAAHADPARIHVVPTCVEPAWYAPALHRRTQAACKLVWIGQRSVLPALRQAQPCLAAAVGRLPGMELRVICDAVPPLEGVRVVHRPWASSTEAAELADGDIGVTWLPDDTWSPGKCGLKTLQYMAAGLPVVANPVGMNRHMVVHGQTGFLSSTPQEWAESIARLACDPELRRRMGQSGRRLVEQRYNVSRWASPVAELIHAVAHGRPVEPTFGPARAMTRPRPAHKRAEVLASLGQREA
jgi:glycosyltransferase involved in cell wall biosynthesis